MPHYNAGRFFKPFYDSGESNRVLVGYDSMSADDGSTDRSNVISAIAQSWDIPNLSDGSGGIVGFGSCGFTNAYSRFFPQYNVVGFNSAAGWARTPTNLLRAPGGNHAGASLSGGYANVSREIGISPNPFADYYAATGTGRTVYDNAEAGFSVNGVVATAYALHTMQGPLSTLNQPPGMGFSGDPFSSRQTTMRMIFTATRTGTNPGPSGTATTGPTDMRLRAVRQMHRTTTPGANNMTYVGGTISGGAYGNSVKDVNFDAAAGTGCRFVDVDCGAGPGVAGMWLINPASVAATPANLQMFITGARAFRDSSGTCIDGTTLAMMATGSFYDMMHASCLGITNADMAGGVLISGLSANEQAPDPYCSVAISRAYLSALAGNGGSKAYPNRIIIYTSHNIGGSEASELSSGISALMLDVLSKIMQFHDTNAAALGSDQPLYLLVNCEKRYTSFTETQVRNCEKTVRQAAINFGSRASYIDLLELTDDGTGDFTRVMPWAVSSAVGSVASSGAGPTTTGLDNVHNSHSMNNWLWRLVWEEGLRANGYEPGVLIPNRGFVASSKAPRNRQW